MLEKQVKLGFLLKVDIIEVLDIEGLGDFLIF
jgi:hypothetical protein